MLMMSSGNIAKKENIVNPDRSTVSRKDQSNIHPSPIQALCFLEYRPKIPNLNIQIPNNIQIQKSNFQNNPFTLSMFRTQTACFEF